MQIKDYFTIYLKRQHLQQLKLMLSPVIHNWAKKGQDWLTSLGTSTSKTEANIKVKQENTNENDENGNTDNRCEYH